VRESRRHRKMVMKALAEGKGKTARFGLKEAGVQSYEPTTKSPGAILNSRRLAPKG